MDKDEERPPEVRRLVFLLISLITWFLGGGILTGLAILNGARTRDEVGEVLQISGILLILICLLALLSIATGFFPTHSLGSPAGFQFLLDRGETFRRLALRPEIYVSAALVGFILVALTGVALEL